MSSMYQKRTSQKEKCKGTREEDYMSKLQVLIFYSRDDVDAGKDRAFLLSEELTKLSPFAEVKMVHKLGFNLEDLHLVAQHRIVTTPSIIVLQGKKVLVRKVGLLPAQELNKLIRGLQVTQ